MVQTARGWEGGWSGELTACRTESAVHFAFQIRNWQHIRQAWGEALASEVSGIVECHILGSLAQSGGAVHAEPDGRLHLVMSSTDVPGDGTLAARCRAWVDALCATFLLEPVMSSAGPLCLWLAGNWEIRGDEDSAPAEQGVSSLYFAGESVQQDPAWRDMYRRDMAVVAAILAGWLSAPADGPMSNWLGLQWQPVCDGRDGASLLYYEALLGLVDANGGTQSARAPLAALERLGFARVLDHHVVMQVIAELERDPDVVLGVNISAQSAIYDDWWEEVEQRLRLDPWVARRFIIEITETARISDISLAVRFVTRMRHLGVRLALDDFGTGFASIRQLLALSPDIVKIDSFFLRQAMNSAKGEAMFTQVVRLAATLGAVTIVDGVESGAQATLASEVGASWQQGHFWGAARRSRPWVTASWPTSDAIRQAAGLRSSTCQFGERIGRD